MSHFINSGYRKMNKKQYKPPLATVLMRKSHYAAKLTKIFTKTENQNLNSRTMTKLMQIIAIQLHKISQLRTTL